VTTILCPSATRKPAPRRQWKSKNAEQSSAIEKTTTLNRAIYSTFFNQLLDALRKVRRNSVAMSSNPSKANT
jgi:hypothetical protein